MVRLGWTHIWVDEFQDTNCAQYDLLRLIAPGRRHNLFVVADDDQIIYQWNGASPRRFDDLRRDYELEKIQPSQCARRGGRTRTSSGKRSSAARLKKLSA